MKIVTIYRIALHFPYIAPSSHHTSYLFFFMIRFHFFCCHFVWSGPKVNLPAHHRHYASIKMLFTPMNPNNRETFELDNALREKEKERAHWSKCVLLYLYVLYSYIDIYLLVEWVLVREIYMTPHFATFLFNTIFL